MHLADHLIRARFHLGRRLRVGCSSYRLKGYHGSNFALNREGHEIDVLAVIRRHLLSRAGAFLDVGVNIGQTLHKVLSVDPKREYWGFEPLVACCDDITRFANLNGLCNVHVLPIGLSNQNGIARFYARNLHDSMASLIPQDNAASSFVQLRNGDEVVKELGIDHVAMIKVDVEGAEWQVFEGLHETLRSCKPVLLFEALPNFDVDGPCRCDRARDNRERTAKLQQVLSDCGYALNQVDDAGTETPIEQLDPDGPYVGNNFTAIPKL